MLLKLTADDWPLVQPTEVHVAIPPVHTAEAVLTPIGMHFVLQILSGYMSKKKTVEIAIRLLF